MQIKYCCFSRCDVSRNFLPGSPSSVLSLLQPMTDLHQFPIRLLSHHSFTRKFHKISYFVKWTKLCVLFLRILGMSSQLSSFKKKTPMKKTLAIYSTFPNTQSALHAALSPNTISPCLFLSSPLLGPAGTSRLLLSLPFFWIHSTVVVLTHRLYRATTPAYIVDPK